MTPKSLLRHKLAVSKAADFQGESHFMRILSDPWAPADKDVKRLVLCTGKVAYDLLEARNAAGDKNTAIVRIEQLYPFPGEPLIVRLKRMANLEEVVWAQEEPKNNGSWFFTEPLIEECLAKQRSGRHAHVMPGARPASRQPPGLMKRHQAEQAAHWLRMPWAIMSAPKSAASAARKRNNPPPRSRIMSTEIKVPVLGESISEATLGQWLKKPGEAVAAR